MQDTIESSRKYSDNKIKKLTEDLTAIITSTMDQIKIPKSSPNNKDQTKAQYPTTVVPANNRSPTLEGGHPTKNCGMWTLKHETSSLKFYEIRIKTELKGNTDIALKNFYNQINMCLNVVTRLL